eukprot:2124343-Amphidinium_carterae.2
MKRGEVELEKAVALDMSMNLVHKVVYLMSPHGVSKDRVFNLDETFTKLLPFAEYVFVEKNSPETRVSKDPSKTEKGSLQLPRVLSQVSDNH